VGHLPKGTTAFHPERWKTPNCKVMEAAWRRDPGRSAGGYAMGSSTCPRCSLASLRACLSVGSGEQRWRSRQPPRVRGQGPFPGSWALCRSLRFPGDASRSAWRRDLLLRNRLWAAPTPLLKLPPFARVCLSALPRPRGACPGASAAQPWWGRLFGAWQGDEELQGDDQIPSASPRNMELLADSFFEEFCIS